MTLRDDINNLTARRIRGKVHHSGSEQTDQLAGAEGPSIRRRHAGAKMSHGLVNNVCRSHGSTTLNVCGAFIPAVVAMPVIRNKTVLHILDGIKGLYHGGPSARPEFVWEHRTIYFATDPVAMDHICWKEIDKKRIAVGKKPIAQDEPDRFSTFLHRQPEHVEIAGAMGLGVWEERKIQKIDFALGITRRILAKTWRISSVAGEN